MTDQSISHQFFICKSKITAIQVLDKTNSLRFGNQSYTRSLL